MEEKHFIILACVLLLMYAHPYFLPQVSGSQVMHPPIYINGDQGFSSTNGVTGGTGSTADPYIIEGWNISGTPQYGQITLIGTRAHVIIRNVRVSGGGDGFFLWKVANAIIANSTTAAQNRGLFLSNSTNITVTNNRFEHALTGIESGPFTNNAISANINYTYNTVTNNGNGVHITYSQNVLFAYNTVSGNSVGVAINTNGSKIANNTAYNNDGWGIFVIGSNNLVSGNSAYLDQLGFMIAGRNNLAVNNYAFLNQIGVAVGEYGRGFNNTISQNYVDQNSRYGIVVNQESAETSVSQNHVTDNAWVGIFLSYAINTTITGNSVSTSGTGISVNFSENTLIYSNNLLFNSIQASASSSSGISWNNTYPVGGNYWSSYTGVDECSGPLQNICTGPDGIGDTANVIATDVSMVDAYPLMNPYEASPDVPPVWPVGSQVTSSNLSFYSATISWTPALDDTRVAGYQVYQNNTLMATLPASQRTYDVTGLNPGNAYVLQVQANDTVGLRTSDGPSITLAAPRTLLAPPPSPSAEVVIRDIATSTSFNPSTLIINAGQTVMWCNIGTLPHSVTFSSSSYYFIGPGNCLDLTFYDPGTFAYYDFYSDAAGQVIVQPVPPGFSITADPTQIEPISGQSGTSTITIATAGGFNGTIKLSASVSLIGLSCSLSTTEIVVGPSTILGISCKGEPGSYTVNVTATDGETSGSLTIVYLIKGQSSPPSSPDFVIYLSTSSISVNAGSQATATIVIAPIRGFEGAVTLTLTNPSGISCNLDRTSVQPSDTSRLTCNTWNPGYYDIIIAAQDGSISHSAIIAIHVSPIGRTQSVTLFGLDPRTFFAIIGVGVTLIAVASTTALIRRSKLNN